MNESLRRPWAGPTALALGIFLKGAGMVVVWPHVLALAAFTVAILAIALARFRRSLA